PPLTVQDFERDMRRLSNPRTHNMESEKTKPMLCLFDGHPQGVEKAMISAPAITIRLNTLREDGFLHYLLPRFLRGGGPRGGAGCDLSTACFRAKTLKDAKRRYSDDVCLRKEGDHFRYQIQGDSIMATDFISSRDKASRHTRVTMGRLQRLV